MRSSTMAVLCFIVVALAVSVSLTAASREPRVELKCPVSPAIVNAESKPTVAYELHITNFESVPITVRSVEIFAGSPNGSRLASFSGKDLSAIVDLVGPSTNSDSGVTLSPGQRAVAFLWLELTTAQPSPRVLRHRLDFVRIFNSSTKADEETVLDSYDVPVSTAEPVVLSPPFNGGIWLAGNGPSNTSEHRRTLVALNGGTFISQRFAIDWVKIGPNGDTTHDGRARNQNYWGYGEPVHAVADGDVTEVVNDIPDNSPHKLPEDITLQNIAGNHVIVRIAPHLFVAFAHMQPGSIRVRVGQHIRRGEVIGLLGDSGNTTGPHLHLQVTNGNSVLGSEGVPFVFDKYQFLGPGADYPEKQVSEPRTHSMPIENSVVKFAASGN